MGMNEGQDPEELCQLCKEPFKIHDTLGYHHPFTKPGQDPGAALNPVRKKKDETRPPTLIVAPAPDLVLRQVLLRKGLVTTEELEAMERELTVGAIGIRPAGQASGVFAEPPANG